jgi:hypothetical protein
VSTANQSARVIRRNNDENGRIDPVESYLEADFAKRPKPLSIRAPKKYLATLNKKFR